MSLEQVVFALAAGVCVVAAVIAVTHRDPRAAGAALLVMLLSLATLYAGLSAPAVAGLVITVALFATLPLVVHLTVPAARVTVGGGPVVAGAAVLIVVSLISILAIAIAFGEVPVTVADRASDGYDMAGLRHQVTGRHQVAAGGAVVVLIAAAVGVRAVRGDRLRLG